MEAGAQGEHKLQRGYLPNFTYSCHYMADPVMRSAVAKFLGREEQQVGGGAWVLGMHLARYPTVLARLLCGGCEGCVDEEPGVVACITID